MEKHMRFLQSVILLLSVTLTALAATQPNEKAVTLIFLPQQQEIELALSAGPEHLRLDASVYVFGKKGYEKIRSGRNGFTCMVNRDGNQNGELIHDQTSPGVPVMQKIEE